MPPHTGFIVAAYLLTGVTLLGMTLAVLLDHRAQRRALDAVLRRLGRPEPSPRGGEPAGERDP